ncbi:NAD(P)/FAD-dependent oxidoreductase [Zobellia barbeyronii]|uniref:NAD(P)/FAD-dependent oxidoreductase n=1 Tax=Zobellia barbeyronii TaxID=2748009 RepID=A0ABS5WB01_9FLAO|nr:NAD(P)/FAD-dependent oxidoreductase [Zobellia barbeyronii]MBT2160566.1 NAD(P)/FAD-dependent oxidoreductase [Zobellia barbeyronii]
MEQYDVIIVGGGLAGLTAAIHLAKAGHEVLVFEKEPYPHHKVCGEYVSNEVLPYLKNLGVDLANFGAVTIDTLKFSTIKGAVLEVKLPLGGTGISRYAFDNLLYKQAEALGVTFVFESVTSITFQNTIFEVITGDSKMYTSRITIGSYGKRSVLDKQLKRSFIQQKSSWLAVKSHYSLDDFPVHEVGLHNFKGGYGGLSKTETGAVNFCYLVSYKSFQLEKGIDQFNEKVVSENPILKDFLYKAKPLFETPLTIAQISFHAKNPVEEHVLMCGDTAGLIHPLCGNGMAMAIHSAKIVSELIDTFLSGKEKDRKRMEQAYAKEWSRTFKRRLWLGRRLQSLLLNETLSNWAISLVAKQPWLLKQLIKNTHGKPIS